MVGDPVNLDKSNRIMAKTGLLILKLKETYPDGPDDTFWEALAALMAVIIRKFGVSDDVTPRMARDAFYGIIDEYMEMQEEEQH